MSSINTFSEDNLVGKKEDVKKLSISVAGSPTEADYLKLITQTPLQHYINECVFESIEIAHKKKRKYAKVLEIEGSGRILKLDKEHWKPVLEQMLPKYEQMEEYLLCNTIKQLIDQI